jgi:hypothetical protein
MKKLKIKNMKTSNTKMVILGLGLILSCNFLHAVQGLEKVIVEKYYVSNTDDSISSIGTLPVGSVTYRIYVDMLPGYEFMMAYGDRNHELFIKTKTTFFNNEDRGSTTPNYTKTQAKSNTVMLDSWLSAGAACVGNLGILKNEDDSIATVVNSDGILANADTSAGIALTFQDGLIAGTPEKCDFIGIDTLVGALDATSQSGNIFSTSNGAWACLNGASGPKSDNKVLIAQITTDGQLSFELNLQLRTFVDGIPVRELYVAKNPGVTDGIQEISDASLSYVSPEPTHIPTEIAVKNMGSDNSSASVYPNPSNGIFYLKFNQVNNKSNNFYNVYNVLGKVIQTKKLENFSGNNTEKIDLSSATSGIYYIEVSINGTKSTLKLIKK